MGAAAGLVKDGQAHLAALDTDRAVYLDGELITRVAQHPAFAQSCRSTADLYDFQAHPDNLELMTFEVGDGRRANRAWQMPTTYEELVAKRRAMSTWAELHAGYMGRSPDHLACAVSGQLMGLDVFEAHDPARCDQAYLRDYYHWARAERHLPHVRHHQPPGRSSSKAWGDQQNEHMTTHIVDEDQTMGITVQRRQDARYQLDHGRGSVRREPPTAAARRGGPGDLVRCSPGHTRG